MLAVSCSYLCATVETTNSQVYVNLCKHYPWAGVTYTVLVVELMQNYRNKTAVGSIEGRPSFLPSNAFLLLWPWPWSDDLDIRPGPWRCTRGPHMNFLGQGFRKLLYYSHADRQAQICHQKHYVLPRLFAGGKMSVLKTFKPRQTRWGGRTNGREVDPQEDPRKGKEGPQVTQQTYKHQRCFK